MSYEVSFDEAVLGPWVYQQTSGGHWPGGAAIGLYEGGVLVAAIAFEGYNGKNIFAHLCIKDPRAAGILFKLTGRYVFGQLGLQRLTLWAEASNIAAIELHRRLGAIPEGRLVGAGRSGDDILISRLTPSCKLWRRWSGKVKQSSGSSELR